MSSGKTQKLGMHKWVPNDYVQMNEFNENFQKIDDNAAEVTASLATKASRKIYNIEDFGAKPNDDSTDDWTAFVTARTESWGAGTESFGIIHFPKNEYYFKQNRPSMINCFIEQEPGGVIKIDDVNPNIYDLKLLTPVTFYNVAHDTYITHPANSFIPTELINGAAAIDNIGEDECSLEDFTNWTGVNFNIGTGARKTPSSQTISPLQVTNSPSYLGSEVEGIFTSNFTVGELIEITFDMTTTISANSNAFVEVALFFGSNRYEGRFMYNSVLYRRYKNNILEKEVSQPNGGAYGLSSGQALMVSICRAKTNVFEIYSNGLLVDTIVVDSSFGAFTDVGFTIMNYLTTSTILKNPIRYSKFTPQNPRKLKLGFVGDSLTRSAWSSISVDKYLENLLPFRKGIGDVECVNFGISGSSTPLWASSYINNQSFAGYDYVFVMLGTNDVQTGVSVTNYIANLTTIANKIKADGSIPIFGIFPIWTTSSISGVTGTSTLNYEKSIKYISALKLFCLQNRYRMADVRKHFGANLSLYGDNIHFKEKGIIAMAKAYAESLYNELNIL